jgi:RNA polymerase sigma-70 factor (ECF subfamily)
MKNFLADQGDWASAAKRGSGRPALPLFTMEHGEEMYGREPAHSETPEAIYERRWALALLERVLEQMQEQYRRRGQGSQFGQLKGFLSGDGEDSRARAAADLGLSPGAVRVAIHRVRREYRALLRAEIAETVEGPEAVDDEIRRLLDVLSHPQAVADSV